MTEQTAEQEQLTPAPEDIVKQQKESAPEQPQDSSTPLDREYTKAQIEAAEEEIKSLTPEQWIEITDYIHSLEDIRSLGEAPGIAWTTLHSEITGGQMNVTSRAMTSKAAVEDLFDTVKYVMTWQKHMKWSASKTYSKAPASNAPANTPTPATSAPPTNEPSYAPVEGSGIEKFTVASIEHAVSKNNHPFLRVKTAEPAFAKWGVNAWKEVVPVDFESWPVGQPYAPPPEMAFCMVDTSNTPKKVTAFVPE